MVDHIIPLHVRPDWRLMLDNTESQCWSCHRRKTHKDNELYGSSEVRVLNMKQAENRAKAIAMEAPPRPGGRIVVVCGPPCGGKSHYVRQNRLPGDLVWDYDEVAASLAMTTVHDAPIWVIETVERMRAAFIESARHSGAPNIWMIACMPDLADRCARELEAEMVTMDPGIAECMRRASVAGRDCKEGIEKWYASREP